MLLSRSVLRRTASSSCLLFNAINQCRHFTVLAIETSCDDTGVAIVQTSSKTTGNSSVQSWNALRVLFHKKITANNDAYAGIHPLAALHSHRSTLALLVREAISKSSHDQTHHGLSKDDTRNHSSIRPDLVVVTRGPGMRSNLSVGLDTAKGLAVAWHCPLVGVHHMQAHALTPRLISAMVADQPSNGKPQEISPSFPFLTVLASGGHTMLIDSFGLTEHAMLAETQDIALGNLIDHAAKAILPTELLVAPYGRSLERFAFDSLDDGTDSSLVDSTKRSVKTSTFRVPRENSPAYDYIAPARRREELQRRATKWGWSLSPPLAEGKGGKTSRRMVYSFAGLLSSVGRFMKFRLGPDGHLTAELREPADISLAERKDMAREVQRVAFEHLASRILLHLASIGQDWKGDTIVVSGGVASNKFLRHVLRSMLDVRGFDYIKLSFPPVELCTDNALMIAWAGIEMYQSGYTSDLSIGPIRTWSMDPSASGGGILGVEGWVKDG